MAGNYPDVPGNRFVFDRDGTQLYKMRSDGSIIQFTSGEVIAVSNEEADYTSINGGAGDGGLQRLLIYFPELRNVFGLYVAVSTLDEDRVRSVDIEWSPDTTTGTDGTWNTAALDVGNAGRTLDTIRPYYREEIIPLSLFGVKALRLEGNDMGWNMEVYAAHVYGVVQAGENPNSLVLWHPTLNEVVGGAYFDWGDSPRSSSADRAFRVRNQSPTLTANDITCSLDALTDGSPAVAGMHLLSDDGSSFGATIDIGSLAPSTTSGILTLRRVISSEAPLGLWAPRLHAAATTWT